MSRRVVGKGRRKSHIHHTGKLAQAHRPFAYPADAELRPTYALEDGPRSSRFARADYLDIDEQVDTRTANLNEKFLVISANILSNPNVSDPVGALHSLVDEYIERLDAWY